MQASHMISKPSKEEQHIAMESYSLLVASLEHLRRETQILEISETSEQIKVPLSTLKLLARILEATSQGMPISIVPVATEMTTQAAADLLGCSRPHLVKLLEEGKIPFSRIGKHRRVKFEDIMSYKEKSKVQQRTFLEQMMRADEESGLYDS
ncbi:MAG: helix-turn-helix domain-containing protein [Bacteroidota bacterium]